MLAPRCQRGVISGSRHQGLGPDRLQLMSSFPCNGFPSLYDMPNFWMIQPGVIRINSPQQLELGISKQGATHMLLVVGRQVL